jgi:hypothetical protein
VEFLARQERERRFGYVMSERLLARRLESWPGFGLDSFFLVRNSRQRIVGCAAPWDTSSFKRTRVLGYHGAMKLVQLAFNTLATMAGFPRLPPPGDCFRFVFLTHLHVEREDPAILHELLLAIYRDLYAERLHFMSAMVPRGSPLERAFHGFRVTRTAMSLLAFTLPGARWTGADLRTGRPGFEMALS